MSGFVLSVRLAHVLEGGNIRLSGDLHGRIYADIARIRNCGKKTIEELREIVRELQLGNGIITAAIEPRANINVLVVPPISHTIRLEELPLSPKLANLLRFCGYSKLGDLHGVNTKELMLVKNCGRRSILELIDLLRRAELGEFNSAPEEDVAGSLRTIVQAIERAMNKVSSRNREIFEQRLFGNESNPRTLEDVGREFKITRERVRQVVKVVLLKINREGGPVLARALDRIARECGVRVCPLTHVLFESWCDTGSAGRLRDAGFYLRVLDHIAPAVPSWPQGSRREGTNDPEIERIQRALVDWLRASGTQPTATQALQHLKALPKLRGLTALSLLAVLRGADKVIVDFPEPDRPTLRVARLRLRDLALLLLTDSPKPLTPEEIIERGRNRFGGDAVLPSARAAENALTSYQGFYRLGPRSFGLRKHFASTELQWPEVCDRFATFLRYENRPVSTIEVLDKQSFPLPTGVNSYELAEIVRGDVRFADLGRRLFSLADWGEREREHIKDLLPRVLAEADHPLTVMEIYEALTRLRSATFPGLLNIVRKHPEIRPIGFGYHGLSDWGDSRKGFLVSNRLIVERAIRRAEWPVRFDRLCEIFDVSTESTLAETLWRSCAGSDKLRRAPDQRGSDTLLLHKSVSLEQALASIFRPTGRPIPAYELEWELTAKFGELFSHVGLQQIEERLAQSALFLHNSAGAFFLDADLDLGVYDVETLRTAVLREVVESHEIISCDDLLERLELLGFEVEGLSAGVLASILRGGKGLQEVGNRLFRAT